jgi:hypothetical protein
VYCGAKDGQPRAGSTGHELAYVRGLQVEVVVAYLEVHADEVHQRDVVPVNAWSVCAPAHTPRAHAHVRVRGRARHEQLDRDAEEAAGLVVDHREVLLLGGAGERVAPEEVQPLPAVQVQKLVCRAVRVPP